MRRSGGLLEHATLMGIETSNLTEEERSLAINEQRISVILDQLSKDQELRRRVRARLDELPPDKPGPTPVLSDKVIHVLVDLMVAQGYRKTECYKLLSRNGLSSDSVETKYKRGKKKAVEKRGTEN
jgi:hypothetical protein